MQKILAWLLAGAFLIALSGCAVEEEDTSPKFRQLTYTSETLTDGIVVSTFHSENTYDSAGFLSDWSQYEDNVKTKTAAYEYDENGNILKYTIFSEDEMSVTEFKYELDYRQQILRQEEYRDGTLDYITENHYDTKGRKTICIITCYRLDGTQDSTQTDYNYNWRGELVQIKTTRTPDGSYSIMDYRNGLESQLTRYDAEGAITDYTKYSYDADGFFCKWVRYNADGSVSHTCERIPDETGLVITELHYEADGTQTNHHDVFTYDEYSNLLMQERYRDGELYWRISHTYEEIETTE